MFDSILQQFLNKQFITTVNDTDHEKLSKVVSAVKEKWQEERQKVIYATMVALDPDINEQDPIVVVVHQAIIDHWPTFVNNTTTRDTPLTYVRAVILEVLLQLSKEDSDFLTLILFAGNNVIRYYKVGAESETIKTFLGALAVKLEQMATGAWQRDLDVALPKFAEPKYRLNPAENNAINKDELVKQLKAATLQTSHGGENPHLPQGNAIAWGTFFSDRASNGIATVINTSLAGNDELINNVEKVLKEYVSQIPLFLSEVIGSLKKGQHSLNLKSDLLFWKESLYSAKFSCSYRDLKPVTAATAMAADLATLMPYTYPQSVNFFMRETLMDVIGDAAAKNELTFSELFESLNDQKTVLEVLIPEIGIPAGRMPLLTFFSAIIQNKLQPGDLKKATGVSLDAKITLCQFSKWLFQDFMVIKVI